MDKKFDAMQADLAFLRSDHDSSLGKTASCISGAAILALLQDSMVTGLGEQRGWIAVDGARGLVDSKPETVHAFDAVCRDMEQ
jgi:hypothetical protein